MSLPQHVTDLFTLLAEVTKQATAERAAERHGLATAATEADRLDIEAEARSELLAGIGVAVGFIDIGEHSDESIKAAVRHLRGMLRGINGAGGEAL